MTTLSETRANGSQPGQDPSTKYITSSSPATGRVLGKVRVTPLSEVPALVDRSRQAQMAWKQTPLSYRISMLRRFKDALHRNFDRLVDTLVAETGKPVFEAMTEFWPAIELVAHYVRIGHRVLAPERVFITMSAHQTHMIQRQPHGVVLVISPWNFPLLLSVAPIAAALVSGNSVIYKPSEYSTQLGEVLASIIREAGFPHDLFQLTQGEGDLGAALIRAKPDKICFTGSVATGRKVAAAAGELLIPLTLELGGKDAAIVLDDADLDRTARGIAWGGLLNAGQACLSIERVYALRSIADAFVQKLADAIHEQIKVGPGETSTMGAITTAAQVQIIDSQVQEAIAQGALVVTGGKVAEGNPQCYSPTVLTNVNPSMRIIRDETFGPVIPVIVVDNEEEAIAQANASPYGLTGSVWTRNLARGLAIAERLEVGHAAVNDHVFAASNPQLPWGGVKDSGYGRTRGKDGLLEMTTSRSISMARLGLLEPISEAVWYPYTPQKTSLFRRAIQFMYAPTWDEKINILLGKPYTAQSGTQSIVDTTTSHQV